MPPGPESTPREHPPTSRPPAPMPWSNATLVEREDLNEELALFRILPDTGVPDFEPGQFVTLGLPGDKAAPSATGRVKLVRRAYSVASSSLEKRWLELYVVLVGEGRFTPKLWQLQAQDRLWVAPKVGGRFTLDGVPPGQVLVMIGTGTGVAPFRSMYHRYRNENRWDRFVLFDGCRYVRDLGYCEAFEKLAAQAPALCYLPTVTREADDHPWTGLRGRVTAHLEPAQFERLAGVALDPQRCHVFLCGNPQMIDQCEEHLASLGFETHGRKHPKGTVHFERYW